jgi:hypothetical protein
MSADLTLTEAREILKAELLKGLPPKQDLLQKSIDYCLDNINKGIDTDHYRACLKRLAEAKEKRDRR